MSFAGKKVAALVISQDDSLRVSGEEALVRELTARGMQSVATYRIAPKEELQSGDRAKVWFEKANVEGVVAMRPVSSEKRTTYNPGTWTNPYYSTFWGYYGYGWGSMYIPGSVERDTVVVVETTIYSVPRNQLLWAAVSETKNPKTLQRSSKTWSRSREGTSQTGIGAEHRQVDRATPYYCSSTSGSAMPRHSGASPVRRSGGPSPLMGVCDPCCAKGLNGALF